MQKNIKRSILSPSNILIPFDKWGYEDRVFSGTFFGSAVINNSEYLLRVNLAHAGGSGIVEDGSCAALYSGEGTVFKGLARYQNLKFFKTDSTQEIVIQIQDKFEVKLGEVNRLRLFKAALRKINSKDKNIYLFEMKRAKFNPYDNCSRELDL